MKAWRWFLVTAFCLVIQRVLFADDRVTLAGTVYDAAGKPIEHATVMVFHAGVKKGYSTFCPSCYVDCGKRAITDANGMFTFKGLSPDLWFELLVAGDGYRPAFIKKVNPSDSPSVTATLIRRESTNEPSQVFRGHVEDSHGVALRDAVVQPVGILLDLKTGNSRFGAIPGLDPIAISNEKGEFEIAYSKPAPKVLLSVEARSMAPTFSVIPAGLERQRITVAEGAVVRGRIVQDGKPVPDAEVGLIARQRGSYGMNLKLFGSPYAEMRIGTQPDGTFAITNVPAPVDWYIYGKMESMATRGATGVVECATRRDRELVNLGDVQIKPAHRLRGRVVLSDGKPILDGMRLIISSERAWDSQTTLLPPNGRFEFTGLAAGSYSVFASVKGYVSLPTTRTSTVRDATGPERVVKDSSPTIPISIDHDLDDFVITLHPENQVPARRQ
jgi:protocatechuate 3,4-dioxygenase beta subunit